MRSPLLFLFTILLTFASFGQVNLINDGDFSITSSAWHTSGFFQYNSLHYVCHSCPGYAFLSDFSGSPADNISGTLYQDFTVPSGTPSVTITFWYRITTAETTATTAFDTCNAVLINIGTGARTSLIRLSNLDHNTAYSMTYFVGTIPSGSYRIEFSAGTDASLPTVFRIDDVAVIAEPPITSSCVTWIGGISPVPVVDSAVEKLACYGIISNSQNASSLSMQISRLEVAQCLGKALGITDLSFLDNFPSLVPALQSLSVPDQRYIKLMLFLEYPNTLSPSLGTDDISPFPRDYFYPNFSGPMKKSDVIKAMLETWNLSPWMAYYNPTSSAPSPVACDMLVSNKNEGWVERAFVLGLLNGITVPCVSGSSVYLNDINVTYSDFYVMLSRLLSISRSPIGYDGFFIPNLFYLNNLNSHNGLEKGVFDEYSQNGFNIPSGGEGLEFQHSYHSNLTEIPFLDNDTDIETTYLKPKLQPLGGGWTHSYSAYIKILGTLGTTPNRILIYWPDGTVHSFLVSLNRYETKGMTDVLAIDSFNSYIQPSKVTIKKGRTIYTFRNIDPAIYNVLSLVSIKDACGNVVSLQYADGYTTMPGTAPKMLTKVIDSFSGRVLNFTYWPLTNYLQSVTDPIGRMLTFYVNRYNHDLDSFSDAKNQHTSYGYSQYVGTFAYRTHLLTSVKKPKGNTITNQYFKRKLSQTTGADYLVNISAVPSYQLPWTQQSSKVTQIQAGQTINTTYIFDASGNAIQNSTPAQTYSYVYDTATNRVLVERDINLGFIYKYSYDANGYLSEKVVVDSLFNDSTRTDFTNNVYGEVIDTKNYDDPGGVTETKNYRNTKGQDSIIVTNEGMGTGEIRHQFSYYSNGLLSGYNSPTGFQTQYAYNLVGNLNTVTKIPYPYSSFMPSESYVYDGASRLTTHIDYTGKKTAYAYDNNDNITDIIVDPDTLALTTHYSYDQNDNPTSITSPKGHITTLSYDFSTDDLIQENDGIDRKRWTYNLDGTLDTFVSKNNSVFKHTYYNPTISSDTTLAGLLFSDGSAFYQYWANTKNVYHINYSSGKENHFWYDARQRSKWNKPSLISTANFFVSSPIDNVTYSYDNLMRPSFIGYPAFGSTSFAFNYYYDWVTKNLATVQDASTSFVYASYSYQKDGKPTSVRYGNGDSIFYHYDNLDQLDSIWAKNSAGTILYSIGAGLDNNGGHTRENLSLYYRGVLDTTLPPMAIGDSGVYSYQLRNRIITGEGRTYSSDSAGDIATATLPALSCTWSNYNELMSVNRSGTVTNYDYDPLHFRRMKDNTFYVVDQQNTGNVIMEATHSCIPISAYVYGNGLVCRIDPVTDSVFYYHYDFRGSVIAITDQGGNLVKYYKYDPFGKVYKTGGGLTWQNPYQYLGKEGVQADDSDLYYMKARYYQPSTGRFVAEDPRWNTNLFTYCNDDPINRTDPTGKDWQSFIPLWGPAKDAVRAYKQHQWGQFAMNVGFFALDIFTLGEDEVERDAVKGVSELSDISRQGSIETKSNLTMGREIHRNYKLDLHNPSEGLFKEYTGIKGIRPDFVDFNTQTIYELKPRNSRSIKLGWRQLERYRAVFEDMHGGKWNTVLDTY